MAKRMLSAKLSDRDANNGVPSSFDVRPHMHQMGHKLKPNHVVVEACTS